MPHSTNILCGPEEVIEVPRGSMGQYLFDCLKKRDPNDVINLDAVTNKTLTCGRALEDSVKCMFMLKDLGIKRADVIAIISENTVNYCLPVLGALYMGVTINLLNPTYTPGELKHGLLISNAKVIFCSQNVLQNVMEVKKEMECIETVVVMGLSSHSGSCLSYEQLLEHTTANSTYRPETLDCEQNAFICLSSGTTGLSKGVLLSHANLRASIGYFMDSRFLNATAEDTTVLVLPFFHIYGLLIQLIGLAAGMKLVLLENFVPDLFLNSVQDHKATKLFLVPPILLFLVKISGTNNYDISSVRDIICGAAPLSKEVQDEAERRLGMVTIRQVYGLTEVCGASTIHRTNSKKIGNVGSLVPGIVARVWDPVTNQVVGPLEVGELCFKGPMVMKGYCGNEASTKDCMDDEGFFHSGDIGYYDDDQLFYVVDRIKETIKYKGFQVPPAELEALIVTHPGVKECGVIGIPNERAGEVPLAYVVPQDGSKITEQEIVDFVAERISINKHLYGGVRFIKEVPKNASGKILRRVLREMFKTS